MVRDVRAAMKRRHPAVIVNATERNARAVRASERCRRSLAVPHLRQRERRVCRIVIFLDGYPDFHLTVLRYFFFSCLLVCHLTAPRAMVISRRVALSSVIGRSAATPDGGSEDGGGARRSCCSALVRAASEMFLPVGYPSSVEANYLTFQWLDCIQGLSSYLRGILATQALFTGMGVGDDASTALAATLQWVTRDGASMLGSLLFAWLGATSFDRNVRQWRLFADLINDFGLTVEMLAPMAKALSPALFVPTMCVASVAKALCGVAAGATRATISLHFARADNLADLCAKEGTQETAVTLIGLLCGMAFAKAVNSQPLAIWSAFVLLTLVHVVANIGAVRCLHLATINALRWEILAAAWARGGGYQLQERHARGAGGGRR